MKIPLVFSLKTVNLLKAIFLLFLLYPSNDIKAQYSNNSLFTIAVSNDYLTIDPHKTRATPTTQLATHLYDTLFFLNRKGYYETRLLANYKVKNKLTWILTLKDNIYFHDGSQLTAEDIIYSFDRINSMPDSAYFDLIQRMKSYKRLDKLTIEIITHTPHPTLTRDLSLLFIIKKHHNLRLGERFIKEKGFIGSGPYQLVQLNPDKGILLKASKYYHGTPPYQKNIKYTVIENIQKRVQAFKDGDVHLIDNLTPTEVEQLSDFPNTRFIKVATNRLIYLHFDTYRDSSPWITDNQGNPLPNNPFKQLKVRQAISYAIDRQAIIKDIFNGTGMPSGQFVLPNMQGYDPSLEPDRYDLSLARKLMKQAGYKDGFKLLLHSPKNRYLKGIEVVTYLAKMLKKINIRVMLQIESMPSFMKALRSYEACCYFLGISTGGDLKGMLSVIVRTPNQHMGQYNGGRYQNNEVNRLIDLASLDFNKVRRLSTFRQAAEIAIKDKAIIPLYFQTKIWAMRSDMGLNFWHQNFGRLEKTLGQYLIKGY